MKSEASALSLSLDFIGLPVSRGLCTYFHMAYVPICVCACAWVHANICQSSSLCSAGVHWSEQSMSYLPMTPHNFFYPLGLPWPTSFPDIKIQNPHPDLHENISQTKKRKGTEGAGANCMKLRVWFQRIPVVPITRRSSRIWNSKVILCYKQFKANWGYMRPCLQQRYKERNRRREKQLCLKYFSHLARRKQKWG